MGNRSITDQEIGLIKALLRKGKKNSEIQFYFNRQDRPVNSGRISQIRDGSYGPKVKAASDSELAAFLIGFKPSAVGVVVPAGAVQTPPSLAEQARALFEQRGRTGWHLKTHETDATECKENFCLKPGNRFADALRSIAGLANNRGGFVFFGVAELPDGSLSAEGLRDDTFAKTDPSEINRCLADALDPVPKFESLTLDFDGKTVGAIYVHKHDHPPIIAVKNVNTEVKEGTIYYRYVGETRPIKPGELRQILAFREQKAVAEFANRMSRVALGDAATFDLDSGQVTGHRGAFVIGEELLSKLQFVREGDFKQTTGAPALRLLGEVVPTGTGPTRTVRSNITDEAALLNFLKGEIVAEPMQYILHSAYTGRVWLPLFYYAKATGRPLTEVVSALRAERATHVRNRDAAAARLAGNTIGAFKETSGKGKEVLASILAGELPDPGVPDQVIPIANAIQALPPATPLNFKGLRGVLLEMHGLLCGNASNTKGKDSLIYRAACRIDELEFGPIAKPGTRK